MNIKNFTYYYFIGVGGIGMSALARYFNHFGKSVMGYDKTSTELTKILEKEGIKIHYQDSVDSIPKELTKENTVVIYTPAIPKDNKELVHFQENKFHVLKRSQALGLLTQETKCLAIAGTHGKTTTSTLLGHLIKVADLPATSFLGGIAENYQSNIILNGEEITITEADEFDRSFLQLSPNYIGITSMDADHLDIYGEEEELRKSFLAFARLAKDKVYAQKKLNVPNSFSYSVEEVADFYAKNIRLEEGMYFFDLVTPTQRIDNIPMPLPGKHNIENAIVAIAIALEIGVSPKVIKEGMDKFKGVKRRFTRYVTKSKKVIIDDYAHHPAELNAIINATKTLYPNKKILGVFQPHLYSRTKDFGKEFAAELDELENLILLDIYPAREKPMEGITSDWLASLMRKKPKITSLHQAEELILNEDFDVLLLMGAGNIDRLFNPLKIKLDET